MIGFLADWFPKQVINDKSTFLTKNWPHVSLGSVTVAICLNCSLGLHMPKKFPYLTCRSVLSHVIVFVWFFTSKSSGKKIMSEKNPRRSPS